MRTRKKLIFGFCYLFFGEIILLSIFFLVSKKNNAEYRFIKLRNVTSSIPDVFFEDDESDYYKTDDVFYLIGNNNEYWIAGMELQNLSESDVGNAYVYSSESLKMLQNAE